MKINLWEILKDSFPIIWPLLKIALIFALVMIVFSLILKLIGKKINNWDLRRRFRKGIKWQTDQEFLQWLRGMKPVDFEKYIATLYNKLGYSSEAVGRSHDGGIDVVAKKNGIKHYIQCKKFISSKVSVSDVRDFYGAMAGMLSENKGIFITTNIFTTEAEKFAEDKPIELIDGSRLIKLIKSTGEEKDFFDIKEEEKCPKCGGQLIKKNGKYGDFFGCSNFPRCKFTKKI